MIYEMSRVLIRLFGVISFIVGNIKLSFKQIRSLAVLPAHLTSLQNTVEERAFDQRHQYRESVFHRLIEVGRDIWGLSCPTSLLKKGHLKPVAQDHVQMAFEYLQGWRLHNISGQPVPVLGHPHSEKVFPDVQRQPPVFQFVPVASCLVTRHHWKESGSVLFALSLQVCIHVDETSPSAFSSPG